jgi:hypothetical protein
MMLIEAPILRGHDRVLEIGRNLAERNKSVALVIRRAVNPGLHAALDVHSGCRRVNPPGGHKDQRIKRPDKCRGDEDPSNRGPEKTPPTWGSGGCTWIHIHLSE